MTIQPDRVAHVLGKRLRYLREQLGMSQSLLAESAAVSQTYLSALERGQKFPAATTLESLASVLGVKYYELFLDPSEPVVIEGVFTEEYFELLRTELGNLTKRWLERQTARDPEKRTDPQAAPGGD